MRTPSSLLLGRLVQSLLRLYLNRNKGGIAAELGLTKWNLSRWTTGGKLPPRRRVTTIAQRLCEMDCSRDEVAKWVGAVHDELNEQAARRCGYGFFLSRSDSSSVARMPSRSRRAPR